MIAVLKSLVTNRLTPKNRKLFEQPQRWLISAFILAIMLGRHVMCPPLLENLAGSWEVCADSRSLSSSPDVEDECAWRPVTVPSHFVSKPGEEFRDLLKFRRSFKSPSACSTQTCKLIFGEVGDSASVSVNGVVLRKPDRDDGKQVYEKNYAVTADIPMSILRKAGDNDLLITVHSFRDEQVGLRLGPIGVAENAVGAAYAQWKAFRGVFVPILCAMVVLSMAGLLMLFPKEGIPQESWKKFFYYAVVSSLFMVSFSEIPRQIFPLQLAVPLHFLLRFCADFCLFDLICSHFQICGRAMGWARRYYKLCAGSYGLLFVGGIIAYLVGLPYFAPSVTFRWVLVSYPLTVLCPSICGLLAIRQKRVAAGISLVTLCGVTLHEWLVGSGFIEAEFLSKFSHCFATIVFAVALVRKAALKQARDRTMLEAEREFAAFARQLDHDIRSPLAVLDLAVKQTNSLPEGTRILVRNAVTRVRDIANTLRLKRLDGPNLREEESTRLFLIPTMVEAIVSEKRFQLAQRKHLELSLELPPSCYGLFVEAERRPLRQVLSNIINNAVEAVESRGQVRVTVSRGINQAVIVIADDGPGLPPEVLRRMGQVGNTSGKRGGSGLGLSHAVAALNSMGATLCFECPPSGGTQAKIALPSAPPPKWFAARLDAEAGQDVVIIDDDADVHNAWVKRLNHLSVNFHHLSNPEDLNTWLESKDSANAVYLVDYGFVGERETGIDLITRQGLHQRSYLVTSHHETMPVIKDCLIHGIRLIPKDLVKIIPLTNVTA